MEKKLYKYLKNSMISLLAMVPVKTKGGFAMQLTMLVLKAILNFLPLVRQPQLPVVR